MVPCFVHPSLNLKRESFASDTANKHVIKARRDASP